MKKLFMKTLTKVPRASCAVHRVKSRVTSHESRVTKRGFTITEMILVVAVLGIVFGISTNIYRNQRARVQFNDSLVKMVALINTARNYAITSRSVYDVSKPEDQRTYIPPEGYGIYIERNATLGQSKMILFANTSVTGQNANKYDAADIVEENYAIPNVTDFESMLKNSTISVSNNYCVTPASSCAVVIFRPPLADTYISNNGDATTNNLINTLSMKFSYTGSPDIETAKKYIHINKIAGFPELEL